LQQLQSPYYNKTLAEKKPIKDKRRCVMDIAALSMVMSQAKLSQQVGVSVLNIAKTQSEQQGQDLVKMLQSVQPHLGGNLDIRI
jgi:Putative motility protein